MSPARASLAEQAQPRSPGVKRANGSTHVGGSAQAAWSERALIAVVMSLAFYRFSITVADPDLWGHVKFGETIWTAGRIALPDPFSYLTAGRLWLNHEWLSEVIFYLVFAVAGSTGLVVMKLTLGLVVVGFLYRRLRHRGLSVLGAGFILVAVTHFFLTSLVTVRTLIFSYPLFMLMLVLVDEMSRGRPRWAWTVPPLFALWANLHPGFIAGLGILGIWSAVEVSVRWLTDRRAGVLPHPTRPPTQAILLLSIMCVLATLLNPYGIRLWGFLSETAFIPRPDITEWQPIVLMSGYGLSYAVFVALAFWGIIYSRRERRAASMGVLLVTALLPLVAIRHTPLAALAIAVLAGEHIGDAWDRWGSAHTASTVPSRGLERSLPVAALGGALLLIALALPHLSCIPITPAIGGSYPARAVGLIRASGTTGNLAIDFDWGEYALYHLSPAVKVSIDGRRETMYGRTIYAENLNFKYGQGDWSALLRGHDTDLALIRTGLPAFNLMKLEPGWRLIYEDSLAALFGREGVPIVDVIERSVPPTLPPDGAGLCFP